MAGMGFMIAASSRKRDDRGRYADDNYSRMGDEMEMRRRRDSRGRYMEEDDDRRMGNDHSTHMDGNYGTEMRRRRDSRGRYMEDDVGSRMAYEGNQGNENAYRPWPEPHIPPYLDRPESRMRDRNVVNIRDYQDKRRIGFGENRMHHDDRNHDTMENRHHMGDAHHTGAYQMTEPMTMEMAQEWVENMQNTDPEHPTGAKWSMESVKPMAMKHGFTTAEKQLEFWAVMNMMYSDYCETAKKHGVSTMDFYADMAKAWMKDKDAVENKTAAYIEYVTK